MKATLSLALVAVLAATATTALAQESYVVDHDRSYLIAVVGAAGILSNLAKEHAVLATDGSAEICYAPGEPQSSVRFTVPTSSLRIDTRRARGLANLDTSWPDAATRQKLQGKMLSDRFLAADRYESLSFQSTNVQASDDGDLWLEGDLTIRGRTNRVSFPVQLQRLEGDALFLRGGLTVKQTDYGMEPESIAGVVRVADAVEVRFEILARPGDGGC